MISVVPLTANRVIARVRKMLPSGGRRSCDPQHEARRNGRDATGSD